MEVGEVRERDGSGEGGRWRDEERGPGEGQTDRLEPGWGREDTVKARESGLG